MPPRKRARANAAARVDDEDGSQIRLFLQLTTTSCPVTAKGYLRRAKLDCERKEIGRDAELVVSMAVDLYDRESIMRAQNRDFEDALQNDRQKEELATMKREETLDAERDQLAYSQTKCEERKAILDVHDMNESADDRSFSVGVKLPDGRRVSRCFDGRFATIQTVFSFAILSGDDKERRGDAFTLFTPETRHTFSDGGPDCSFPLREVMSRGSMVYLQNQT